MPLTFHIHIFLRYTYISTSSPILQNVMILLLLLFIDDIVKQSAKDRKKQLAAKKPKKPVVVATAAAKAGKKNKKNKPSKAGGGMEIDTKAVSKVAESVGKGKAKRNAQVAQKRGTAMTGVASVKDIQATIAKEAMKLAKQIVAGQQQGKSKGPNEPAQGLSGKKAKSMKISFRTSDIRGNQGAVAKQIGAVLSKGPKKNKNGGNSGGAARKVILK